MAFFVRGLLLYLCMAFALALWQPATVFNTQSCTNGVCESSGNSALSWFDVKYNSTSGSMYVNSNRFSNNVSNSLYGNESIQSVPSRGSGFLTFIDPIFQVLKFAGFILNIIFSPLIILGGIPGIPFVITFFCGIIPTFILLVSIIAWFRSGAS